MARTPHGLIKPSAFCFRDILAFDLNFELIRRKLSPLPRELNALKDSNGKCSFRLSMNLQNISKLNKVI